MMKHFQFSKMQFPTRLIALTLLYLSLNSAMCFAVDSSLKLHYIFNSSVLDSVPDNSGNGYKASLKNGAVVKPMGRFNVLDLGSLNGYLDMTSKPGVIISTLADFTMSLYVYVDASVNVTSAGNFIWTFANSADMTATANGNMFLSAIATRYAISKTNWSNEKSVSQGVALTKGSWQHITYTQSGTIGILYVNGVQVKTGTVSVKPSDLGATTNNYLGKSCYVGDAYLKNSLLTDFRVYNRVLSTIEITGLASSKVGLDSALAVQQLAVAKSQLVVSGLDATISNLTLPTDGGNGIVISWISANPGVINNTGAVTRPAAGASAVEVKLTATLSKNGVTDTKEFTASVVPYYTDKISAQKDSANLTVPGNLNLLRTNIVLSNTGIEGSTIIWSSDKSSVLSSNGVIVNRPVKGSGNAKVILTATIKKGSVTIAKTFIVNVAEDEGFSAYLFAYFTGNNITQEAFRFALSDDGFVYKALNGNNPVINSADVSSSGGIRDPHILRGQNNDYFMVATDMVSALGWSSNRAMILLKSNNLTDWTSTVVNIPTTYSQYAAADRVWAPQTIYDPAVGKYMVYFAMRLGGSDYDKIYYAYANSTFTALESAPKLLFDNNGLSTIDADIVAKEGLYYLFFKTEGNGNGIKKAVSSTLTGGYVLSDRYLQSTTNAVEGGCVFRMYNSDNWILMYDMYTSGAYQFTTSTDLTNYSVVPNTVSFDFTPRHGTIIPITAAEKQALNARWGVAAVISENKSLPFSISPNPATVFLNVTISNDLEQGAKLNIFDFKGNRLFEKNVTSTTQKLNISMLKKGIYLLGYSTGSGLVSSAKFIVN
ncbi:MAG: T9SS type A sorting domain-containing protein [Paludibacter sp.]|nr:T9SS type A sorting domain-containing protein [Paludibacter sp.]